MMVFAFNLSVLIFTLFCCCYCFFFECFVLLSLLAVMFSSLPFSLFMCTLICWTRARVLRKQPLYLHVCVHSPSTDRTCGILVGILLLPLTFSSLLLLSLFHVRVLFIFSLTFWLYLT